MPIYEYQCTACGHQLEALQSISEEPLKDCPKCGKPALDKLVSAAGFQLKGSGWYMTDYKAKPKTSSESSSESKAEKTDTGSTGNDSSSNNTSAES